MATPIEVDLLKTVIEPTTEPIVHAQVEYRIILRGHFLVMY
jgi:hypothetical protein